MSVPVINAWLDDDGRHVWQAHPCVGHLSVCMLPWPTWTADEHGVVHASIHCLACGAHEFPNVNDARRYETPDEKADRIEGES